MRIFRKALVALLTVLVFSFSVVYLTPYVRQILLSAGLIQEKVLIAGTGSMYPTFPKGEGKTDVVRASEIVAWPRMRRYPSGLSIFGINLFNYKIGYGDIVEFENEKTREISKEKYGTEAGFVKRIIALQGDTINLRDGYVLLNGKTLDESYTAKPRSSYGGDFLPDCENLTVPSGKVFVMGDNRKASFDSRFDLGLIDLQDIHYVLPWDKQGEYRKLWRDTTNDLSLAQSSTLDPAEFVKLLNDKRKEKNLKPYRYNIQLSSSSKIRGFTMIKSNNFSPEASKSGMTLEKSIRSSGYQNIIFAEVYTRGFYEAEELLDNFLEFPDTKKILYSNQYQDIGVGVALGEINNCPVQVIVSNLGGYVPPNYTQKEIASWESLIDNLEKVLPSWRALKQADNIDQTKLDRLINILETRLGNAEKIVIRMKNNQWLTEEEKGFVDEDKKLGEEGEKIISELMKR